MRKRKTPLLLCVLIISVVLAMAHVRAATDPGADSQAAIAKTAEAFVAAFEKGDANAVAAFWALDGDYTDIGGRVLKGRKAIAEDFADLFAGNKGLKLRIEIISLRFPTADTAIEDGVTSVLSPNGDLPNRAHYTNFLVKRDGAWQLESVRESAYVPPNNNEFLRPLEWTIGEWVEDTKEPHVGRVAFDWSPDQNFILGVRAVGIKDVLLDNGSQRIGWDPAAKMIRSWNFESDGGFGEGSWKKDGDKWIIKMSSVLRSGSLMTATTVVSRTDADTMTWQSTEQRMDDKVLPDSPVIKMKRVK